MSKEEVVRGELDLDDVTLKKVASLIAYDFTDRQVADALLLSAEQVALARETQVFRAALAEHVLVRAERQVDLADGWDAIEERALTNVLDTLKHNRDPRYSLLAAKTANSARRRSVDTGAKTIDAGKAGNVIVLTLSKTFVDKKLVNETRATLEISDAADLASLPKKITDIVTPGSVTKLLGAPKSKDQRTAEMDELFGDVFDQLGVAQGMIEK